MFGPGKPVKYCIGCRGLYSNQWKRKRSGQGFLAMFLESGQGNVGIGNALTLNKTSNVAVS
jgi:hypothetical protein